MSNRNHDFYQDLRRRTKAWLEDQGKGYRFADYLLMAPDLFHLLSRLVLDKRVPVGQKARLGAAIAYFIWPVDLLPEAVMGPAGYIDDVALAAYVLNDLINSGHGDLAREHWAGEEDLLAVVQRTLETVDKAIGSGLWKRLKAIVED